MISGWTLVVVVVEYPLIGGLDDVDTNDHVAVHDKCVDGGSFAKM